MGGWIAHRFSLQGRLGVDGLWKGRIALGVSGLIGIAGAIALAVVAQPSWPVWIPGLAFLPLAFMSLSYLTMLVRRLHDHGRSGLWLLTPFVVAVGIVAILRMIVENTPDASWASGIGLIGTLYLASSALSLALVYLNHMRGQAMTNHFGAPIPGDGVTRHGPQFWFRRWFWYPIHWKGWVFTTLAPLAIFLPMAALYFLMTRYNLPFALAAILWVPVMGFVLWGNLFYFRRSC